MTAKLSDLFPLAGTRVRLDRVADARGIILRLADGERAGTFSVASRNGALVIEEICVDEPARGYGLGSETAHLLRDAALAHGWDTLLAWAPPDRGLAVYFWSRMGLRPLFGEHPGGGIWLERRLR